VKHGARVPFRRSAATSADHTPTAPVVIEVLEEYRRRGCEFDRACCIYPTAPFVTAARLREASDLLDASGADAVVPVTPFTFPIWRSFTIDRDRLAFNWPEHALTRSQDLTPAYHDCGQFYFVRTSPFLAQGRLIMENTRPIVVSPAEAQDIDTEDDWTIAELKYSLMQRSGERCGGRSGAAIVLRPAAPDDWARLLAWRNDPATRAASKRTEPVAHDAHIAWLTAALANRHIRLMIASDPGRDVVVGTCRLDLTGEREAEVSITIDPLQRGRGYATAMLRTMIDLATDIDMFKAEIKADNVASMRAFAAAGFAPVSERDGLVSLERRR
jgi:N-acylneuraminate cytidylyltransferase